MTTTQNLSTDDIVTFRSDFSAKLVGVEFIVVNADAGVDAETGNRINHRLTRSARYARR
jgi:hypothetical protein